MEILHMHILLHGEGKMILQLSYLHNEIFCFSPLQFD